MLEAELVGPIARLVSDRSTDERIPFTLKADGVDHRIDVSLRGKSRLRICELPPLRLHFSPGSVAGTIFEGQDDLRLVTHCQNNDHAEQDLLLEYAAYRILNMLTENSYRVRLLHIAYTDDRRDNRVRHRFGFLIETSAELAERIAAERVHLDGVSRSALQPEQAAIVYVFQYLIGNTDWSLVTGDGDRSCCFNGNLFANGTDLLLVPYDFDLSGLVDARYAKPDPSLRISRVTQRLYRGYCTQSGALREAVQHIADMRAEILGLLADTPGLSRREAAVATKFIEKYFAEARNPRKLVKKFAARCL